MKLNSKMLALCVVSVLLAVLQCKGEVESKLEKQLMAVVGSKVTLPCKTSLNTSVDWKFHPTPYHRPTEVYTNNMVYENYKSRVEVKHSDDDDYTLTLISVALLDAGMYTCIEDGGTGTGHTLMLIVSEPGAVPDASEDPPSSNTGLVAGIIILSVVCIILLVILIYWCTKYPFQLGTGTPRTHGVNADEELELNPASVVVVPSQSPKDDEDDVGASTLGPDVIAIALDDTKRSSSKASNLSSESESSFVHIDPSVIPQYEKGKATDGGKQVRGVCILEDRLYVARTEQADIEVYDRKTMKFIENLRACDERYPGCMALCPLEKCLYIAYYLSKLICKVNLIGKAAGGKLWSVHDKPDGVATSPSRTVIVVFRETSQLAEFNPDGTLKREIKLPSPIVQPRHAIVINGDQYLVCYGVIGKTSCGVVLVDNNGAFVKNVHTNTDHPLHLAVDNRGFVLVADFHNDHVTLLSKNLEFEAEAIPKAEGVRTAFRLCFDDKFKMLYIAANRQADLPHKAAARPYSSIQQQLLHNYLPVLQSRPWEMSRDDETKSKTATFGKGLETNCLDLDICGLKITQEQ